MRAILDAILAFIGAESLTDLEFEYAEAGLDDTSDDAANYAVLDDVLDARDGVSSNRDRLRYYYLAKGLTIGEPDQAKSNILIGAPLC